MKLWEDRIRVAVAMIVYALWGSAPAAAEDPSGMQQTEITKADYRGWPNTYRIANGLVEARVVTDIGPRIMDFRPSGGGNVLYLRESEAGKHGETEWVQRGGWRLWVAPERRESTYALDNAACRAEVIDQSTLRVTGPLQPAAGIQKEIDVSLLPGERRLRITSRIKNVSDHALTYAAWSLPVLRRGGRAFVPMDVGSPSAFDATRRLFLWSYAKVRDPRYHFGDRLIEIDHSHVQPAPAGQAGRHDDESKIGVDSAQGWAAYLVDGTLFLKRFPHDANGQYPDGGATVEVYSSHEFLELENLGPLTTIAPGEALALSEDWWLFTGVTIASAETEGLDQLQRFIAQAVFP